MITVSLRVETRIAREVSGPYKLTHTLLQTPIKIHTQTHIRFEHIVENYYHTHTFTMENIVCILCVCVRLDAILFLSRSLAHTLPALLCLFFSFFLSRSLARSLFDSPSSSSSPFLSSLLAFLGEKAITLANLRIFTIIIIVQKSNPYILSLLNYYDNLSYRRSL